jgi:hypothetical protein
MMDLLAILQGLVRLQNGSLEKRLKTFGDGHQYGTEKGSQWSDALLRPTIC